MPPTTLGQLEALIVQVVRATVHRMQASRQPGPGWRAAEPLFLIAGERHGEASPSSPHLAVRVVSGLAAGASDLVVGWAWRLVVLPCEWDRVIVHLALA